MSLCRLNGYLAVDFLGRAGIIDPKEGQDQQARHDLTRYLNAMRRCVAGYATDSLVKYDHKL